MTSNEKLTQLLAVRTRANQMLLGYNGPMYNLSPAERAIIDKASKRFRDADAAIVTALRRLDRPEPAILDGRRVVLWLTKDRLNFVACNARGVPLVAIPSTRCSFESLLYRYPKARAAS